VVAGVCAKCKKNVGNEWVLALPGPYHCLLHIDCYQFFNYNHAWPHEHPAQAYYHRRRFSSPGLLEQSQ
jgi:hypothetical protein